MSLDWANILDLYMSGCGNSEAAISERFIHLTEGYRGACGSLDLPELYIIGATEPTIADQDYIEMDADVYSIYAVSLKDTGQKLDPEPAGFRGRKRFYETGYARPPISAGVNFYVRKGNRLYFRDTPDDIYTMVIDFKVHPPAITSSTDLTEHPITPPQYDMALVRWAMGNYYLVHPGEDPNHGDNLIASAQSKLHAEKEDPVLKEIQDIRGFTSQRGYDFGIGGR